jgi:hypothetical protein
LQHYYNGERLLDDGGPTRNYRLWRTVRSLVTTS